MAATASYPSDHLSNGYSPSTTAYTNGHGSSMDGRHTEYTQSGLSSPYQQQHQQQLYTTQHSEDSVDATSASHYTPGGDVKFNPSGTPTSEYGMNPSPARSTQFPEYMHRPQYTDGAQRYHHSAAPQSAGPGQIPQPTSPSMPESEEGTPIGDVSDAHNPSSNIDMPLDPSIAAPPPHAYTTHHYAPYATQQDAPHYPPQHMYPPHQYQYPSHAMPGAYGHVPPTMSQPPPMVSQGPRPPGGGHPLSTVYSFVPIPGTHQQKRPRRRYEEIERMYKCGWQGCEKAYGTLNHLNAHVTMQTHGTKRTPEEFKEIRKEWKQRKKEDEQARKAVEERQHQHHAAAAAAAASGQPQVHADGHMVQDGSQHGSNGYPPQVRPQLPPPMGYAPAGGASPYVQQNPGMEGMPHYAAAHMPAYYPNSPYNGGGAMYHSSDSDSPNSQQVHSAQ